MTYPVYAMRDIKTQFLTPMTDANDAVALRNFTVALKNPANIMHWSAADYELYCIGEFDAEYGIMTPLTPIRLVARGSDIDV